MNQFVLSVKGKKNKFTKETIKNNAKIASNSHNLFPSITLTPRDSGDRNRMRCGRTLLRVPDKFSPVL